MAKIDIDFKQLDSTISAIDDALKCIKSEMRKTDSDVDTLMLSWKGKDSDDFKNKWLSQTFPDSTYTKLINELESYRDFLKYARRRYYDLQRDIISNAGYSFKW